MAYTLGIDLDIDQVKLCLVYLNGPQQTPKVDWLIYSVPFTFGPDYYCEFGGALMETIAGFLFVKKIDPQQINKIYFVNGMPFSAFQNFEEGLHYTANVFIQSLFDPERVGIVRADGKPHTPKEVLSVRGEAASAFVGTQFYGSAYVSSRLFRNAVVLDVGARETHLTPILKGLVDPQGRARLPRYLRYRLTHDQLLSVGLLYTQLVQISHGVILKGNNHFFNSRMCRMTAIVSLLKLLSPEIAREHDFPLPSEDDALVLLARAMSLDLHTMDRKDVLKVAQAVYDDLADSLGQALDEVLKRQHRKLAESMQIVSTGIGGKALMAHALRNRPTLQGRMVHLADRLPHRLHEATTAYGIALYAMERLMDVSFAPDKVEVLA